VRNEGGAVYNAGSLTVTNSVLSDNSAGDDYPWDGNGGDGGAIYNAGSLSMTGGTLSGDSADSGGAVFSASKASAGLTGVTLTGNMADDGGAIWNDSTMTLSGCSVGGNTASDAGGGIYARGGRLTIQSACNVTGNSAPVGADLYSGSPVKISRDSTVRVTGP
jgi:hypothetical protein